MHTLRTIGIVSGAAALLLSGTVAFAEEGSASTNVKARANVSGKSPSALAASTTLKDMKAAAQERLQKAREDAQERMKDAREKSQERVKEVREKAHKRVEDIRDSAKKEKAARLAAQFDKLNSTWTDHFARTLDRLDAILQKVADRAAIAATNGKDVAATNAAIATAKTAIASARTAVSAQAAKTYTLDTSVVTTATTTDSGQGELMKGLRTAFKNLHQTLFKDLFALRDGVMKDAHTAVQSAHQALSKIPKVDEAQETSTESESD